MIKIDNKDGQSLISIGINDIGWYFKFKEVATVVWYDCSGTVSKYICQLPVDKQEQKRLKDSIIANLYNDYTDNEEELYQHLKPLFRLLPKGKFTLGFSANKDKPSFLKDSIHWSRIEYENWWIIDTEITHIENTKLVKAKFKEENKHIDVYKYWSELLLFTTRWFYECDDCMLIPTQSMLELNEKRVAYFESEMKKGKRPFILVLDVFFEHYYKEKDGTRMADHSISNYFVLDGHHKLKAYKNLGLIPPIASITLYPESKGELFFYIDDLYRKMFPWQLEHLMWFGEFRKSRENSDSIYNRIFDKSLREKKYIVIKQILTMQEAYESNNQNERQWLENRFLAVEQNKFIGKGLIIACKRYCPEQEYIYGFMEIKSKEDLIEWKKLTFGKEIL